MDLRTIKVFTTLHHGALTNIIHAVMWPSGLKDEWSKLVGSSNQWPLYGHLFRKADHLVVPFTLDTPSHAAYITIPTMAELGLPILVMARHASEPSPTDLEFANVLDGVVANPVFGVFTREQGTRKLNLSRERHYHD